MPTANPRVVIVGGGFGGLNAAVHLSRLPVRLTVIDRKNHHTFQPLLYQVATAGLSPGEITAPIRGIVGDARNSEVLLGDVSGFDLQRSVVQFDNIELDFDYLVVAAGASHSYFGHENWEPLAPGLKTIEDAIEIRRRVLLAFELAERQAIATGQHEPLNIVVVGGGPTGVELAGTVAEIARHSLAHDFRAIDPKRTRVFLIEGGPRVLAAYPPDLSASAQRQLERLGVEVHTSAMVTKVEPGRVQFGDQTISSAVTLWAAGVAASPLGRKLGVPCDRSGRVIVNPDLSIPGHANIFVIGDLAAATGKDGKPLPGLAPVAIQQGRYIAKAIRADLRGKPRKPFHFVDKGTMATIGRAAAVGQIGKLHFSGLLAWLLWLFVHIMYLVGFRNRLLVLIEWAWSYITYQRSARLITGSTTLPGFTGAPPTEVEVKALPRSDSGEAAD